MTRINGFLLAAVSAAAFIPSTLHAGECPPQKIAATVSLQPADIPLAPVSLNGRPKHFIVATGAYVSQVFPAAVRELDLPRRNVALQVVTGTGATSTVAAGIAEFAIGGLRAQNISFMMTGEDNGDIPDGAPVGIIGPDVLQNYDADFDFGAGKLNLIDPNHCAGQVVYWPAQTVAVIPFRLNAASHIVFPATVDGRRVEAMLSTGAPSTSMNLTVAEGRFDVDVNAKDVEKLGEIQGKQYTASYYRRQFKTIALEGVVINNPDIVLLPDMVRPQIRRGPPTGGLIADTRQPAGLPDLTLGMSTLSKLHVYIAYKERKLYVTPAENVAPQP